MDWCTFSAPALCSVQYSVTPVLILHPLSRSQEKEDLPTAQPYHPPCTYTTANCRCASANMLCSYCAGTLSFNIPPILEPAVDAPGLTCCEAPQMKETRRKTTVTLSLTKVSAVLNPTSSPKTMSSLLPPAHSPMGLGFIDPGRPQTEEREENNAPRPDVGGLMLKPRSCPVSEPR